MSNQDKSILDAADFTISDIHKNVEDMTIEEEISYIFQEDPLYQVIEEEGLTEELIPESLLSELNRKNQYTIAEVADRLGKKDYQVRNIIQRNGLEEYVQITQAGKLYRLDYKGIYRLYLIFLLQEQLGKRPVDIASLVGVMPETVKETDSKPPVRKGTTTIPNPSAVSEQLNGMEKQLDGMENQMMNMFLYMQLVREHDNRRQAYEKAISDVSGWEKEMENVNHLIELHESIVHMEKEELHTLKKNVNDVVKEVNKTFGEVAKSQSDIVKKTEVNSGFFAKLFSKKKSQSEDYKVAFKEIDVTTPEEPKTSLAIKQNELEKLKANRAALEKQKTFVHERKDTAKREYQELKNKIEQEKQRILKDSNNPAMKLFLEQITLSNGSSQLIEGINDEKDNE